MPPDTGFGHAEVMCVKLVAGLFQIKLDVMPDDPTLHLLGDAFPSGNAVRSQPVGGDVGLDGL